MATFGRNPGIRLLLNPVQNQLIHSLQNNVYKVAFVKMSINAPKEQYRDEMNSLQIQLSSTQAGPGRAVKEQQEQNSPNHVQRINLISVIVLEND